MQSHIRTDTPAAHADANVVRGNEPVTNHRSTLHFGGGHVPALDGIRGLAIALVIARHISLLASLGESTNLLDRGVHALFAIGWIGVDLFFVLSGFLITGILLRERERAASLGGKLGRFYWRRFLRIIPLYYLACAVLFFLVPHLPYFNRNPETQVLVANQAWYWLHGVNILEVMRGGSAVPYNTGHFWSLAVEEQFYLVWPLVVLAVSRRALWRIVLTAIIAGPFIRLAFILTLTRGVVAATVLSVARFDVLLTGALLSLIAADPDMHGTLKRAIPWAAGLSVAVLVSVSLTRGGFSTTNPVMEVVGYTAIACLCGCAIAHAMAEPDGRLRRVFDAAPLRRVGGYAYCLYVVHYPLMLLLDLVWTRVHIPTIAGSRIADTLAYASLLVVLSGAAAWVSWRFIESKALAYKDQPPWRRTL